MAAGILYVRLSHGPIAFDFIVPPVERGINAELTNNTVSIDGAELRIGRDGYPEFRLRDLSVLEPDGAVVLSAPLASFSVSTRAMLVGRIVPARIELIDPVINLAYSDESGLIFEHREAPPPDAVAGVPRPVAARRPGATPHSLNIAEMLTDSSKRARKGLDATSYLTEFGLSNATVVIEYAGQRSSWNIPEASIDFNHRRRRSIISGRASVSAPGNAWAFSFLTDDSEKTGRLQVKVTVRDLIPSSLAAAAPPLALLRMFQVPLAGDATIELSKEGDVVSSDLALELGRGRFAHPDLAQPFEVSAGLFKLLYSGADRRWELQPSPVKWADGSIMFTGSMQDSAAEGGTPNWQFRLDGKNGVLEGAEFGVPPLVIESWVANGKIIPRRGLVEIAEFHLAGGGGVATAKATILAGPSGESTSAELSLSPMPLDTLKALWPKALAPGAREWVGESVSTADFKGGSLTYANGDFLRHEVPEAEGKTERLSGTFEVSDATFVPLPGMSPIKAPRGLVQIQNNALEVVAPEAAITLPDNSSVALKSGRMYAPDVMLPRPESEITFSTVAALGPFLKTVEQLPVRAVREAAPFPEAGDGKVDAQIKVKLPLISKLDADDVVIEGKAKVSDGRVGKVAGQFDVQGFTLNLDLSATQLDAKGDLIVNGIPAKIVGQRMLSAPADQQPPIKVLASLDEADRKTLGLDVNDVVRGVVPIEVSLQRSGRSDTGVRLKADLTSAELVFENIGWTKAVGRKAVVETDVVRSAPDKVDLKNIRVEGDDIAAEGWVTLGENNRMREFYLPTLTLNVVSRLEVQGALGKDNIWKIKVNGPTFDGRELFRTMFSVGDGEPAKAAASKKSSGTDLTVDIKNMIGASEISLRGLKVSMSKRDGLMTALDAKGMLDGNSPVAAKLDTSNGRRVLVDAADAGQLMKFIDFYSNMQGGRLRLEVNLDGKGAADKTGVLWVDNFKVLGDPVVSEVVSSADSGRPAIGGNKSVTREVFEFTQMRAPFSAGYGQLALEDSYIKGPIIGASLRGKLDFKTRRVNVGGTYIPLQGLNSAFAPIPLFGQLISGANGEGIFGITFGVQGQMSNPQVIVNPLSMVTPGIFREIFQFAPPGKVQIRENKSQKKPVEDRVRSSSATSGESKNSRRANSEAVDGWSSTTDHAVGN